MSPSHGDGSNALKISDDGYNFPPSHWMCWSCRRATLVLGARVGETCPRCGGEMEHLDGVLLGGPRHISVTPSDGLPGNTGEKPQQDAEHTT
jgi:hypothetical protein